MVYMWAVQGFFSALIHLCVTIVAGTIAFAVWEPFAGLLLGFKPAVAMSVGLLLPFVVLLIVLRMATDKLIKKNMRFHQLIGGIGGGACGLVSGVLTAGVLVMGLGLLPVGNAFFGYQPYSVTNTGSVVKAEHTLWVKVDDYAYKCFATLSAGAFSPSFSDVSLATHAPDLPKRIASIRLASDENASIVARPEDVKIDKVYSRAADDSGLSPTVLMTLGSGDVLGKSDLVVVDTAFTRSRDYGMYDDDSTFRVAPVQVRLVAMKGEKVVMHAPVAYSKRESADSREYKTFTSSMQSVWGSESSDGVGWVFIVPKEEKAKFFMIRNLRMELPKKTQWADGVEDLVTIVGVMSEADQKRLAEGNDENTVGEREGARSGAQGVFAEQSNKLPRPISRNYASGLSFSGNAIDSGRAVVTKVPSGLSKNVRIDQFKLPSHMAMVRVKMETNSARSILGKAVQGAASLGIVGVKDSRGNTEKAVGWVLVRGRESMEICAKDIRSVRELPIQDMRSGDELYVYFMVGKDREIEELITGSSHQDLNLTIK